MSDLFEFEKQLKSLVPLGPAIDRDELLYRAGYNAALAAINRAESDAKTLISLALPMQDTLPIQVAPSMQTSLPMQISQPSKTSWRARLCVAAAIFTALILGTLLGSQIESRRELVQQQPIENPIEFKIAQGEEPPLPKYIDENAQRDFAFASLNKPNYIDLRNRVLKIGMNAMPDYGIANAGPQSSKPQRTMTPFSYDMVSETGSTSF